MKTANVLVCLLTVSVLAASCRTDVPRQTDNRQRDSLDFGRGFLDVQWGTDLLSFEKLVGGDSTMQVASVISDTVGRVTFTIRIEEQDYYFLFTDGRFFAVDYFLPKTDDGSPPPVVLEIKRKYGKPDSLESSTSRSMSWLVTNSGDDRVRVQVHETVNRYSVEIRNTSIFTATTE